jgi:hypothetical protein
MVYLVSKRALLVDDVADDTLATLARQRWCSRWSASA